MSKNYFQTFPAIINTSERKKKGNMRKKKEREIKVNKKC